MSSPIPRLWQHIAPRRKKQLGLLLLVMIVASFAEVISIGAVLPFLGVLTAPEKVFNHELAQPIINLLNLTQPQDLLLPLTLLFIAAAIVSAATRLLLLWLQTRLGHAIGADFSIEIYQRTLYQPYQVHLSRNSSQVIAGISGKVNAVVYSAILPLLAITSSTLMLTVILAALIAIDPWVALIAFGGFGSIYLLITLATRKRLAADSQKISRNSNQVIKALQEGLGGIRDVLIDGTQKTYCAIYRTADISLRQAQANNSILGGSPRFLIEALGVSLIALLAYGISGREAGFAQAIPILGALALGAQRLLPVMQQLYQSWSSLKGGQVSLNDVLDLISQPLPDHVNEPVPEPIKFADSIRLNNIGFRYSDQGSQVLSNINLDIKKGSRVGFIGITGSGKSTLLDIVMGLLPPTSGSLEVDGTAITTKNHRAWQAHISHVPQAIFLADISTAENIAFGVPLEKIDMQRVKGAAEKAQIAQTIESWDKQYQTSVGERGVRLSGGQRQRIGIARALYKKANVIVFDEATSALDNETEAAVMDAINAIGNDITVLMVAHRLSTLEGCDTVYELSHGKIIKSGTPGTAAQRPAIRAVV
jgi:ABC-type bacteriocin/lantibiotic exporter with double-glycine peptidase domain